MGFHHVAFACRDTAATHRFYTEVMGFELVKVNVTPTPGEHGGWTKHLFYRTTGTGGSADQGMLAFWEVHDPQIGEGYETNLNKAAGLPGWMNHIAFDAPTRDDLERRKQIWRERGQTVVEIDHDFCISIYINDPDGNMVEFCHGVRDFTAEELADAQRYVTHPNPPFEDHTAKITVHHPIAAGAPAS